ncbi:hypothetical protein E1B28_010199 [Marasmius oreades]|uniref:BTB domain-containing protein n=1 Tax=Marasmius oreades TaxID=181124 RepID=A0A9P7URJ0_9AGAR|nr:uncharacterized protein E1B28_010199 [Marasmius oreades]KAG7091145.1 hypothetical protein E1B28_010199 [Marasmius oreades]
MVPCTTTTSLVSNYAFDSPDADVVIIPSDASSTAPRKLRLHSTILSLASPFFQDMFSLPQSLLSKQGITEIPVSEPFATLETLFRFVYPVVDPVIETLDELGEIIETAIKYDFLATIEHLRRILVEPRFLQAYPLRVFAIAWRYEFTEEIELAAQNTLNTDIVRDFPDHLELSSSFALQLSVPLTDDLKYITAHTYRRLIDLHRRRAHAAQELLKIPYDVKCPHCNGCGHAIYSAPKWWYEWQKRAKEELALRPSTRVIFQPEFMSQAAAAVGCPQCITSMLGSFTHLEKIKRCIDDLPCSL